jgi:uncharacterized protein YkwD
MPARSYVWFAAIIIAYVGIGVRNLEAKQPTDEDRNTRLQSALEDCAYTRSNAERVRRGLGKLKRSQALQFVARRHSERMCRTQVFAHESSEFPPGWRTLESRLRNVSVSQGGENIGYLTVNPDADAWAAKMVSGWMGSPAHRNNLLEPRFRYMDVGVSLCRDNIAFITQVFSMEEGRHPR